MSIGANANKRFIEISAFYLHPTDMMKMESQIMNYSTNPIQLRVVDSFEKDVNMGDYSFQTIGNGLAAMCPDLIFKNMCVKTTGGVWKNVNYTDFGPKSCMKETISQITYLYSPGNDGSFGPNSLRNDNHYTPAIYTQYEKGNWYMKSLNANDTIDVFFNVDPLLFYVRSNYLLKTNDFEKTHVTIYPNDEELDFYILYRPAYLHLSNSLGKDKKVDFLFENINDSLCCIEPYKVDYYPTDSVANNRYHALLKNINYIVYNLGNDYFPQNMNIILNSQRTYMIGGRQKDNKVVFSLSRQRKMDSYGLVLVDHSALSSQTLIHELLHLGVPQITATTPQLFFFRESIIEYVASYLYSRTHRCSSDIFVEYEMELKKHDMSFPYIKSVLSNDGNTVRPNSTESTYWIYYIYFPVQLHNYAKVKCDELRFVIDVMDYVRNTSPNDLSLTSFSEHMKKRNYKNIEKIWNRIL